MSLKHKAEKHTVEAAVRRAATAAAARAAYCVWAVYYKQIRKSAEIP